MTASDQLRSLYDRWSRLEEAKTEISDDLKDLFAEAKANGYDAKALRAAFRMKAMSADEVAEYAEHESLVDVYLHALGVGTDRAPRAQARVARETSLDRPIDTPAGRHAPPGSAPRPSPATIPDDDDDMAIPAILRRA